MQSFCKTILLGGKAAKLARRALAGQVPFGAMAIRNRTNPHLRAKQNDLAREAKRFWFVLKTRTRRFHRRLRLVLGARGQNMTKRQIARRTQRDRKA
jgi:hypothetical protein